MSMNLPATLTMLVPCSFSSPVFLLTRPSVRLREGLRSFRRPGCGELCALYRTIIVVELLTESALFLEETGALRLMPVHERIMASDLLGKDVALPLLVQPSPGFIMPRDPLRQLLMRLP